jgi:pyruvate dehydrogenase kinase 2/3/4
MFFALAFSHYQQEYYEKKLTSISLETLMKTGRGELLRKTYKDDHNHLEHQVATERILMQVASFIHHEMPIRLAHRIHDLDRVPMMRDMPSVQTVKGIYINSFLELIDQPKITSPEDEDDFALTLQNLYENHSNVLIQMAKGAYELRAAVRSGAIPGKVTNDVEFEQMDECHSFLDRFYMSRIGIRVLAGQYLALKGQPLQNYVGMICSRTSPFEIVRHAAHDATLMCTRKYGDAPDVVINGRLDLTFPYIPTHLHYILLELLKNAMRATVEQHGIYSELPPVTVIIADSPDNEDIVIKVADEGGGIPRSQIEKIWSYLFTTADPQIQEGFVGDLEDHSADSPLAGLGYGLPISRSYARYFGGDLDVLSMEGFGTDAFVYLVRLGDSREPLAV